MDPVRSLDHVHQHRCTQKPSCARCNGRSAVVDFDTCIHVRHSVVAICADCIGKFRNAFSDGSLSALLDAARDEACWSCPPAGGSLPRKVALAAKRFLDNFRDFFSAANWPCAGERSDCRLWAFASGTAMAHLPTGCSASFTLFVVCPLHDYGQCAGGRAVDVQHAYMDA